MFEVGNKVAVRGAGLRDALTVHTVSRVLKRFVEMDDGSKFDLHGRPYPHRDYSSTYAVLLTPELAVEARKQLMVRFLSDRVKWAALDDETLEQIVALARSKDTNPES